VTGLLFLELVIQTQMPGALEDGMHTGLKKYNLDLIILYIPLATKKSYSVSTQLIGFK
jgi:hypothetical protein